MKRVCSWFIIVLLWCGLAIEECRVQLYLIPVVVCSVYLFFNLYPHCARRMHRRKLTYEDLEDLRDTDPELRRRFQIVFTRVQQIGGAVGAGILVAYGWRQWHSDSSLFETVGLLGGLLSLYARFFGYVGGFCISCLYRLKGKQDYAASNAERPQQQLKHPNPNAIKPQYTKSGDEKL